MKSVTRSFNRTPLRCGLFTVAIALCCFAFSSPLKAAECTSNCDLNLNTAVGNNALSSLSTGSANTAVGFNALRDNASGGWNVAIGSFALASNTTGQQNMAIGTDALTNSNANFNLAIGFRVGYLNTTGSNLTGIGAAALRNNTTGNFNTAIGATALRENTSTDFNVAVGDGALTAFNGTAFTDGANTALGSIALNALTTGQENVAVGRRALEFLTDGSNNTVIGWRAGDALTTTAASGNLFLGSQAGSLAPSAGTYNNTILIGITGDPDGNNPNGRAYIGNVRGVTTGNGDGIPVIIDSTGQLGTSNSSRRFKEDIKTMDHKVSEAILKLKPVTFHYKGGDGKKAHNTPQFGLIAEDVEQVNRDLVVYGQDGKVLSVRYDAVNVMLLNEFLKEHKKVEEQQASIADLKSTVALQQKGMEVLTAQLREQAAQIQKVSAQLEASKPAPKVVLNR